MSRSPVLLLLFNRPDLTKGLILILKSIQPHKIYISVDGPRPDKPNEIEKVRQVISIARSIDWTPNVRFLIRERNLGCGRAVSTAIDWFFEQEEQGIILEDDCHPSVDFFPFCDEMLVRYANDERVATVAGHSLMPVSLTHSAKHYFSKYVQVWGWATWRRFWKSYDVTLGSSTMEVWRRIIIENTTEGLERDYWLYLLEGVVSRQVDTWDFQAQFCAWRNQQLNIVPDKNLVANVGIREDATHTVDAGHLALSNKSTLLPGPFPQQEPKVDKEIDTFVFIRKLFASKAVLHSLLRSRDEVYCETAVDKQRLVALNQKLTRTAEKQHDQLQELAANLIASKAAYEAKIAALEKQVGFYISRKCWLQRWYDRICKQICHFNSYVI